MRSSMAVSCFPRWVKATVAVSAAAAGWLPDEGCTVHVNVADFPGSSLLTDAGLGALAVQPAGSASDGTRLVARPRPAGTDTVAVAVKAVAGCAVSGTCRLTAAPGASGIAYFALS